MSRGWRLRKPWLEADLSLALQMVRDGASYQAIALEMGRSYSDIQEKMARVLGSRSKRFLWVGYDENGDWIAAASTADDLGAILMQESGAIRQRDRRFRSGQSKSMLSRRFPMNDYDFLGLDDKCDWG